MKEMIGERLKALRVGVRLSQTKLAGILGTQQSSINRYEQGQAVPGPEMFVKYADYFDVSMDYLYCRTDEPRGKLYDYKPQALKEKMEQSEEMRDSYIDNVLLTRRSARQQASLKMRRCFGL